MSIVTTPPAPPETTTLLDVHGLAISYGSVRAVDGANFQIARAEKVALVGESGSGKSSIANSLLGLLPPTAVIAEGEIHFDGRDLATITRERDWLAIRGGEIALIPQDPLISLDPSQRAGRQIVESLRLHRGLDRVEAQAEAVRLLTVMGIANADDVYHSYPHELSGGQLQRILISIALAGRPSLLVADEPTSGLDVTSQKLVLDEIDELVRSSGTSLLLITHDLAVAQKHADRVIVLQRGEIVESVPAEEVASSTTAYTRKLFEAAPSQRSRRLLPSEPAATIAVSGVAPALARFDHVTKKYQRKASAGYSYSFLGLDDVAFEIGPKRSFGLVGESGSGKSTAAKIAAGIIVPDGGRFVWAADPGTGRASRKQRLRDVQFVFQNPYSSLNPRLTIDRILREPLDALNIGERAGRTARVAEALESVGLPGSYASRKPGELSGGQRQRVAIARAVIVEPKLLILDEPVSALDVTVQRQVLQLLVDLQARLGLSYLFISHDLAVIRLFCDDVAVIKSGRIVEQGPVEGVFGDPQHEYTRELIAAIP